MLEQLSSADFTPLVHQTFQLWPDRTDQSPLPPPDAAVRALELIEVTTWAQRGAPTPAARAPFSLVFCESSSTYLPQRMYTLTHPALGRLDLFLVPIGVDARGVRYQAVFS